MKWPFFILSLFLIVPVSTWLRRNPKHFRIVWGVFGFLPFGLVAIPQLDIALIDWSGWPGYTKGVLYSAIDAAALAILLTLPKSQRPLPFLTPMLLYLGAVLLSALHAQIPVAAFFYATQLLRIFLVYFVVARACAQRAVIPPLLTGLTLGLCFQAATVLYQRYGLGILQTAGSFGHQNSLGLVSNLVVLPLFALFLSGRTGWIGVAGPLAGCIIAVLTTSRATLGLLAAGMGLIFLISIKRQLTPHKVGAGLIGMFLVAVLAPIAVGSFEARFAKAPIEGEGTYDERVAFVDAAKSMLEDHPFGVGANNFVIVANSGGYFERAGVTWARGSRGAHVHNIYWLTLAETGYIGLVALLYLLFRPLKAALTCGWRHREDRRGDLLLGLCVSLLILYIHCYFEWIFFFADIQYIFAVNLGMIAGLTEQLGYWHKKESEEEAPSRESGALIGAEAGALEPALRRRDDEFWGIAPSDAKPDARAEFER